MTILHGIAAVLAVLVFFLIRAEFREDLSRIKIFKPLSTILVISIALLSFAGETALTRYSLFIIVGLVFSFGGDMALMYRHKNSMFRLGLGSFLLAHVVYTVAFSLYAGFSRHDVTAGLVMAVAAVLMFLYLKSGLEGMMAPVALYILIISLMVVKAYTLFYAPAFGKTQAAVVMAGALLFYVSDVILAVARFKIPFRYNRISLAFYYSGQFLIAMSCHMFAP